MISDQQLIAELATTSRTVTTALLKDWRKTGLLPPLNTRGLGRAGKAFFWTDPEIISRAKYVYDALLEFRDPKRVLWLLWIVGFDITISQIKRIWLYRLRHGPSWTIRHTEPGLLRLGVRRLAGLQGNPAKQGSTSTVILNTLLAVGEPLVARNDWIDWKVFVLAVKDLVRGLNLIEVTNFDEWTVMRLISLISTIGGVAELSDLIASATADELISARRAVAAASPLLEPKVPIRQFAGRDPPSPPFWRPKFAKDVATPLILVTLLFIRAGRERQVDRTVRAIAAFSACADKSSWQARARFARRIHATWRDLCSFG